MLVPSEECVDGGQQFFGICQLFEQRMCSLFFPIHGHSGVAGQNDPNRGM